VYVRTAGKPIDVSRPVQEQIRSMGGGVTLREVQTLEQDIQNSLWQERLVAGLACFFSFVALLLAGIGLYGTLAYSVMRRRRELGIRIAIGAQVRHVLGTVCGKMILAVSMGVVAGWLVSATALQFAKGFLFEVEPFDKLSFSAATLAVLVCAGIAALMPAWRAVRTNAARSLREP
jgi:ABC-type antimicrobial peptide transport system permease subunit